MADEYTEQLKPGGIPGDRALETANRDSEVVRDAIRGMGVHELATKYDIKVRTVQRILHAAAAEVRKDSIAHAAHAFHMQRERIERLYALVELELQAFEAYRLAERTAVLTGVQPNPPLMPVKFDDRPFRIAVMLFDRQAKLLGLDPVKVGKPGSGNHGWLEDAPLADVIDYAKQLKMKLPSEFET